MTDENAMIVVPQRAADRGPFYTETPPELKSGLPYPGPVAEPWNAATAFLFVAIVVYWVVRLRGRLKNYPFLAVALPILFVGGVGGTLYHGLRNWSGFFWMDVIPIYFLGLIVSVYWWIRLGPRISHLVTMIAVMVLLMMLGQWQLPTMWAIQLSYAMLALLVLIPLGLVLFRTRCRHAGWVATSLISFGIAWFFRIADTWEPPLLPMGTHWLWHTFGALTTFSLSEYVYRIEGVSLKRARK
ncbi:MAG TPA: hypothetical protein VHR66_10640 [Gemmataceae bacterium]|jgi:hypothetical protein|nr:hypothetical protein [Gemmataceae bacterium]